MRFRNAVRAGDATFRMRGGLSASGDAERHPWTTYHRLWRALRHVFL